MTLRKLMQRIHSASGYGSPIFQVCWELTEHKRQLIALILLRQMISLLSTWALISKYLPLLILLPLLGEGVRFVLDCFFRKEVYIIKKTFRKLVIDHFCSLPYCNRKKTEMLPFSETIQSATYVLETSLIWGIPTIVDGTFSIISTIWAVISFGYCFLLPIMAFIYWIFNLLYLQTKTTTLKDLRMKRKEEDKKIDGIKNFRWHELQNLNANSSTINQLTSYKEDLDMQFNVGWETISTSIIFVSLIISATGLYPIKKPAEFFAAKVIFDNLIAATTMLSHFGNYWSSRSKDFDKFADWYEKNTEVEPDATQYVFPNFGLKVARLNITLNEFQVVNNTQLTIQQGKTIMLRGPSGCGKTQTLNAMQGLILGAEFDNYTPQNYTQQFEYCNQQTREYLPTTTVSLREMLSDECNINLIMELIQVAQLQQKFPSPASYDIPLENLSGGEKMRLSIVYTLWRSFKQRKTIIVLDEPEQGLDEECRTNLLRNVSQWTKNQSKVLMVVFHGSVIDIWNLRENFDYVWEFEKNHMQTIVKQQVFSTYALEQRNIALTELR